MPKPDSGLRLELPTLFVEKITPIPFASLAGMLALAGAAADWFDWSWKLLWLPLAGGTAGLLYRMAVEIPRKLAGAYDNHRLQSGLAAVWMIGATFLGAVVGMQAGQTAGWTAAGVLFGSFLGWCLYSFGALMLSA